MTAEFTRDVAATAAVLGFFASSWIGWAQDAPPIGWRKVLVAGGDPVAADGGGRCRPGLAALVGRDGVRRRLQPGARGRGRDRVRPGRDRRRLAGPAAEGRAGPGLGRAGRRVHLFPVAWLLRDAFLYVVAALVTLAALAAVPVAIARSVAVSAVTGLATGVVLLVAAVLYLADALLLR